MWVTISRTKIKANVHSLRWKFTVTYLLLIVIAFGIIGVSLVQLVGEYLYMQRIRDDQRIAENLSEQLGSDMVAFDVPSLYKTAQEAASVEQARILLLDPLCVVQLDTDSELNGIRFMSDEVSSILQGERDDYGFYETKKTQTDWISSVISFFSYNNVVTGIYANGIYNNSNLVGILVYLSPVQEIYQSLRNIQVKIVLWLFVVATAMLLTNAILLRTMTRPIGELSEGIAKMAQGDLSARVKVRGKNEFAQLASAFNAMSERIEQLDNSRSQFVSNASHELKTPLSTMKILIESLLYQDALDENLVKEFLGDINAEIDRLNRVVSDLLTLVNMDSSGKQLNLAELDVGVLLQEQVKRLSPLARENGIELDCSVKDSLLVSGDKLKLQQVLYNVIDNAIKYTARTGQVHCSAAKSGKKVVIRISDTGIGIPQADLPHIFDRFYRVDKARSRATGGTGLGLSIVKQIVLLHGGNITATSTEGKGSVFTIELPILAR